MRMESFTKEIHRIRKKVDQAFHHSLHTEEPTRSAWRSVGVTTTPRPSLTIRDVMQKRPIAVRPEAHLSRVLALMAAIDVSGLPVVDAEGLIVGAVNESDLLKVFHDREAANVASVMTLDPDVISVHAPLVDLVDQIMSSDLRRVLVHEDGRLVGIITRARLMPAILEAIEERGARNDGF